MGPGGRKITPQWLRERLAHLLDPPGSTRQDRLGSRGYAFRQFKKAFDRYLGTHPAHDTTIVEGSSESSRATGATGEKAEKPSKIKDDFAPDEKLHPAQTQKGPSSGAAPDAENHPAPEKPRISADTAPAAPDAPDEPGRVRRNKKRVGQARPNGPDPSPQLDLGPEPSLLDYFDKTTLADDIRQLHADNPTRSVKWLAIQSGQPPSVLRAILEPGEEPR
jgi:hypothetical protein